EAVWNVQKRSRRGNIIRNRRSRDRIDNPVVDAADPLISDIGQKNIRIRCCRDVNGTCEFCARRRAPVATESEKTESGDKVDLSTGDRHTPQLEYASNQKISICFNGRREGKRKKCLGSEAAVTVVLRLAIAEIPRSRNGADLIVRLIDAFDSVVGLI